MMQNVVQTSDMRTVVHSRWKTTDAYPHHLYCMNCYVTFLPNYELVQIYNIPIQYCPNCGARMTKEDV